MAEIFRREIAANPEPFTGERLTSALGGQTQIEHYHRYLFARSLCTGLDVLDVATGEGYGAAQLAQVARSVIGVDCDAATVASAMTNFSRANLSFIQADARALPLADASVDVVVSFETIEHFDRQAAFVAEIARVLRAGGRAIVSTPDRNISEASGMPPNEFHVRELSRAEFLSLLRDRFAHVEVLLQRSLIGSALMPETATLAEPLIFDRDADTHFGSNQIVPRAPYFVAVASDRPLDPLPFSLFIERSDIDTDRLVAEKLTADFGTARTLFAAAEAELAQAHAALTDAHGAAARAMAAALANEQARAAAAAALDAERSDSLRWQAELEHTRGSLRTFLRQYLPRLRRHFSQRS